MLEKVNLKEYITDYNLPQDTKFKGYAIHLIDSDEFLLDYKIKSGLINKWWSKTPETAKKFQSLKKAIRIRNEVKPEAVIVWMFDTGPQIIISAHENEEADL